MIYAGCGCFFKFFNAQIVRLFPDFFFFALRVVKARSSFITRDFFFSFFLSCEIHTMGCNNRDVIRDSSEWVLYKLVSASGLYIFPSF